mgnify:CR=1 FL=1
MADVEVLAPESLRKVKGGRVVGLNRKGKFLLFHLSNGSMLVFHLRMTGNFTLLRGDADDFLGQYRRNSSVRLTVRYSY